MTDIESSQSDTSSNDTDKEIQKIEKRIKDIERFKEGIIDVLGVAMEFTWQPDTSANEVNKIVAYPVKEAVIAISNFSIGVLQNHLEEEKDSLEGKELSDTEKEVRDKQNSLKILDGITTIISALAESSTYNVGANESQEAQLMEARSESHLVSFINKNIKKKINQEISELQGEAPEKESFAPLADLSDKIELLQTGRDAIEVAMEMVPTSKLAGIMSQSPELGVKITASTINAVQASAKKLVMAGVDLAIDRIESAELELIDTTLDRAQELGSAGSRQMLNEMMDLADFSAPITRKEPQNKPVISPEGEEKFQEEVGELKGAYLTGLMKLR